MSAVEKLPEDFCANPDVAWTFPKVFYTSSQVFEHEKEAILLKAGSALHMVVSWLSQMTILPVK